MNYQQQFLSALFDQSSSATQFDQKALAAYQGNLFATAARALEISYPTLNELAGETFIKQLAMDYLLQYPFQEGDWAEWGGSLSDFLTNALGNNVPQNEHIQEHPYFAGVAELDWCLHQTERGSDATFRPETFALFNEEDPGKLYLDIAQTVTVIPSEYPIVDIYLAHQQNDTSQHFFESARKKLEEEMGQTAMVYRPHFKALVEPIDTETENFLKAAIAGENIDTALNTTHDTFDFQAWLPHAVENRIVLGVNTAAP